MKFTSDCIRNYGGKNFVNEKYIFSEMCQGCSPSEAKYIYIYIYIYIYKDFVNTMIPKLNLNQPRKSADD